MTIPERLKALSEFSEHEAYYRLGYDSEKEPCVKYIIEGARGQFNEDQKQLDVALKVIEMQEHMIIGLTQGDYYIQLRERHEKNIQDLIDAEVGKI